MPERWQMDGASADEAHINTSNQTSTRQAYQPLGGGKRKKDFTDQGTHKRVVSNQMQGTRPAHYSIVYQQGSREQLYIIQNGLCFHCTAKPTRNTSSPLKVDICKVPTTAQSNSGTDLLPGSPCQPTGNRGRQSHRAPHRHNHAKPGQHLNLFLLFFLPFPPLLYSLRVSKTNYKHLLAGQSL